MVIYNVWCGAVFTCSGGLFFPYVLYFIILLSGGKKISKKWQIDLFPERKICYLYPL